MCALQIFIIIIIIKYVIHCICGDQISHTQSMVNKRGLTNQAKINVKKSVKAQHSRIPINPAILTAIGHRFTAQKREKNDIFYFNYQCV